MNVSLLPSSINSPNIPGSKLGIQKLGKREEFNEMLSDIEKKGQGQIPLSMESQNFEPALLKFETPKKNLKFENLNVEKFIKDQIQTKEMPEKELEVLTKIPTLNKKLESNELFLFQRELANKMGGKNEALHSFSKIFNVEKTEKKPESTEPIENVGNLIGNNKELQEMIKTEKPEQGNLKFDSPKQLFNWISQVIGQNKVKVGETLNLQIRDNNLGEFNIAAQTAPKDGAVNMAIISQTKESDEFFKANEKELIKSLESAGVKVGKIEIMNAGDSKAAQDSGQHGRDMGKEYLGNMVDDHFSQREQLERDSQRRQEIWRRWQDRREA